MLSRPPPLLAPTQLARVLAGPWLGWLLDPPHSAYTAQGPHPKGRAEPGVV